ncbi:amidase [Altererythrobacter sp.]|uniref:amidase n=1 Tax=Altererythrobacter sp. TaxID=1872480 RepID=UPI003D014131
MKKLALLSALALLGTPLAAREPNSSPNAAEAAAHHQLSLIAQLDDSGPMLNAVIVTNPNAPGEARDASNGGLPLGGRTILVKDNIETREWPTTAGSLALKDNATGRDAPLITRLRAAGGVVLGKTNLSEWANIRDNNSTSGWSAVGGLTRNPHATDRSACGSSAGSGAAVAAGLAWAAIGTETNGSITCPASINGIVGFKPTVGMVSRTHVVPISASQDTAGPMANSVHDAALLLSAIAGGDPLDPATAEAGKYATDFTQGLAEYSLRGVRIGVMVKQAGSRSKVDALFDRAMEDLERAGAVLVPIDYDWPDEFWPNSLTVLLFELRRDMNAYLATLPDPAMPDTLTDLVAFNYAHGDRELRWFGQDLFEKALQTTDEEAYRKALAMVQHATREDGIDRIMAEYDVSFLIAPTVGPAWTMDLVNGDNFGGDIGAGSLPAIAGYPHLTVPMGAVEGLPVGLSFMGAKWQDHEVLKAGAAYERARTAKLPAPSFKPWQPAE